ncbi:MAG: MarR family transcriptional regulator [Erysipelotrichaceae bacterium]|nr:MarR family transcriptional regulator [Erysipelotrichaceae bacterium]
MERSVIKEIKEVDKLVRQYVSDGHDPRRMFNLTQFQIVHYLLKHADENVCQKDLEAETHLKKASITGAIDSLTEKGMVRRVQSEEDRRMNYIRLTEQMLEYKQNFEIRIAELNENITRNIETKELEAFYRVLDQIKENIGKEGKR